MNDSAVYTVVHRVYRTPIKLYEWGWRDALGVDAKKDHSYMEMSKAAQILDRDLSFNKQHLFMNNTD